MTKKLIPTMVGVALAGGMTAAAADVTVFGHLDAAIINFDDNTATGPGADDTNFVCTTCSIGFKGSEDLGNGLKAIFKLDWEFDMFERNSGGAFTDRDQWIGLKGGFGQVRLGTISTVYKSHGAKIDPMYRTQFEGRRVHIQSNLHSGANEETRGRATNTVRWDSADFNGLKLGATYTLDSDETDGEDDNPYGIGASYKNGGLLVFADYITNDGSVTTPNRDRSAWKVGGKFGFNNFNVYGQYEDLEFDNGGGQEATNWHVGGSVDMGNNMIYAAYGNYTEEATGGDVEDTDSWTIALMHSMSKRTKVYAAYNNQEDDDPNNNGVLVDQDLFGIGIKHKF